MYAKEAVLGGTALALTPVVSLTKAVLSVNVRRHTFPRLCPPLTKQMNFNQTIKKNLKGTVTVCPLWILIRGCQRTFERPEKSFEFWNRLKRQVGWRGGESWRAKNPGGKTQSISGYNCAIQWQ